MKKAFWIIIGVLSTIIGLYPIIYFVIDKRFGLLGSKPEALLNDNLYNTTFYIHIILGGLALLIGWLQFSTKLRRTNIKLHRFIGQTYVISVLFSGMCGLYIAIYAMGGIFTILGFITSDIVWMTTTILGLRSIRKRHIERHRIYMIFSYAICFSAVTLRIWLPLLELSTGDFLSAYRIVAWLSWLPNILFAYYLTSRRMSLINKKLT